MSHFLFLSALVSILAFISPYPWVVVGVGYGLIFIQLKHQRFLVLGLMVLLLIRLQFYPNLNTLQEARVVELNENSVLGVNQGIKVLVSVKDISQYGIGDRLVLHQFEPIESSLHTFGFDFEAWAQANTVLFTAKEKDINHSSSFGFLHWLSMGGNSNDKDFSVWIRRLFFQSSATGLLGLLISSGFIFQLLFSSVSKLGSIGIHRRMILVVETSLFIYLAIGLGYPLALYRVFVGRLLTYFIKDQRDRWSVHALILSCIQPTGWTQIAWLLPMGLSLFSYYAPKKQGSVHRSLAMMILLHYFQIRFGVLEILLFPWIRRSFSWILGISFLFCLFPYGSFLWVRVLDGFNQGMILLSHLGIQTGRLNLFMGLILSLIFVLRDFFTPILWAVVWSLLVMLGIPLSAFPLFYQVSMINVGQGDAILFQAPFNQSVILMDTGNTYAYGYLQAYLDAYAIHRIDTLILTHADSDHSANAKAVMQDYAVSHLVTTPQDVGFGSTQLVSLPLNPTTDENDASLIFYLSLYQRSFLFTGDISVKAEKELIQRYNLLKVDVLKVAHHGSKTSTSKEFLHQIEADVALISVGKNTYGHPHWTVLERLDAYQITGLNTQSLGDLQIVLSPFFHWIIPSHSKSYGF